MSADTLYHESTHLFDQHHGLTGRADWNDAVAADIKASREWLAKNQNYFTSFGDDDGQIYRRPKVDPGGLTVRGTVVVDSSGRRITVGRRGTTPYGQAKDEETLAEAMRQYVTDKLDKKAAFLYKTATTEGGQLVLKPVPFKEVFPNQAKLFDKWLWDAKGLDTGRDWVR